MKQRITGRVVDGYYEIVEIDGSVSYRKPLIDAREDRKLKAAIERNGWERLPGE